MSAIRRAVRALQTETVEPFTNVDGPRTTRRTRSGVKYSKTRAMQHAAVWACIRNRAEDIAKLPVRPVEYVGSTRLRREAPPWLEKPNPEITAFELFERTVSSVDADGNAFWHRSTDRLGRIAEVWPLPPGDVEVFREPSRRGQPRNPKRFRYGNEEFGLDEIVHFTGFTLPGRLRGLNPIQQHMHSIGLSVAAEEYGESFFGNAATPSGIIEIPGPTIPTPEQLEEMQDGIARDHQGIENAHRPGILFGGAVWKPLTIANDAAQFLETRKYQVVDIARIWRMPPHKIGELDRATFSNIEQQAIEYVGDGLHPMIARIEAQIWHAGLLERGHHLKFNLAALLRGDTEARYRAYSLGIQWGWLCPDDVRELEDMNPLPDGQGSTYLRPLNMVPSGWSPAPAGTGPTPGGATTQVPSEAPA